ncbi:hypothetical protein CRYUN_Cryun02cG0191300 [Craigia yunnanensis]
MEIALESTPSFPVRLMLDGELKHGLHRLEKHISLTIKQAKSFLPGDSLTVTESNAEDIMKFLQTLQTIPPRFALFFLLILHETPSLTPSCISFAAAREATFKVANIKAQGTVLGTVYGVIGCFLFERFLPIRFLSLLPWFLFTSFLRQSKMYGQVGGISAVIGAVLILGRKNFGPPTEFAVARIIETFIGLSCSIVVELLFQPTRASTLTKIELSKSLETLYECIGSVSLQVSEANLVENQKKLKIHVNQLGKFIGEAEVEPNFWFLPFHSACYDGDLKLFKESVGSLIKYLGKMSLIKSLPILDKEFEKNNISHRLEMGKSPCPNFFRVFGSDDEDEMDNILSSFLQHSKEVVDITHGIEGEKEIKSQIVLSLSALGYCIKSLIRETSQIEEGIRELVQWENPSRHVNLHEISCKLRALNS